MSPEAPILVVDDDPAILGTVADILDLEGYQVQTAQNGQEALLRLRETRPSLVLLDMRMPVMDGWGFSRALAAEGIKLPIIVMTAARDAKAWAAEIGAEAFVSKPFELPDLLATVERVRAASA